MSERYRILIIGGGLAAGILSLVVVGLMLLNDPTDFTETSPTPASANPSPLGNTSEEETVAEVERAYLRFWEVWTRANADLDPSLMAEVTTGHLLELFVEQLQELKAKDEPARIAVEHNYEIVLLDPDIASVEDRYVNHSVRIDSETLQPIEPDPNVPVRKSHTLRKVNGQWKVAEIIEYR
ncbi:hypothetical protein BH23PLA1_BH23PLA1_14880 [soil metagenome]